MTMQRTTRNDRSFEPTTTVRGDAHPRRKASRPARQHRTRQRVTPHLTTGQYVRLLAVIDDAGGAVSIDAISRALPRVSQPVSAVFDLCDAGILNVDWEAAFDGDMHVWRVDR